MKINNSQNLINQQKIKTEIVEETKNDCKPILQYLKKQNKPTEQPKNQLIKEKEYNNNFNEMNTTNNDENVKYTLKSYKKYNKSLFEKVTQNLNLKTLTKNNIILKNMLEKLKKLKEKHDNNNLNFEILNKEKELLEDIFNYCFSEEALEFFKLAEKCELKEKLDNSSYKFIKFIKNIHNKLKRLIDFYEKNRTFSLEIFYKPEQKFNENNLKEKTNNNKLWIEKIDEEKKENPNKIVFEEEELSKKEALKKGITVTLNEHAQKLQNLNCKIHNNKKEMEEYLDYYISKTFKKIVILLHKFANIYELKDLFNLDVKSRIFTERKSLYDSLNILKAKEQKILNINNKILGFLAEKVKSSSNEFKFKKLHEIINKIKEKQIYLDEIENFVKVLFKSNENEEDAKKPIEMKLLNLKDAQSCLEKNFENFKKTNTDTE